jgi:hypothetical protein
VDGGEGDLFPAVRGDAPLDPVAAGVEGVEALPGMVALRREAVEDGFAQVAGIDEHRIAEIAVASEAGEVAAFRPGRGEDRAVALNDEVGVGALDGLGLRGRRQAEEKGGGKDAFHRRAPVGGG